MKHIPETSDDDSAYFVALLKANPTEFIADALPCAQAVKEATTADAVKFALGCAKQLYAPMMVVGRFDEVKALHDHVQVALYKLTLKDATTADAKIYQGSMSIGALDAMLALCKNRHGRVKCRCGQEVDRQPERRRARIAASLHGA